MTTNDKLVIFDTTLRDGEQSPGASMTRDEKVLIAKALERMRVDVIEAGFPIASPGDFESVKAVATEVQDSIICGLARAKKTDIERAAEALKPAAQSRIHTFIATSPIHMQHKLRLSPDEVVEQAVAAVKLARQFTDNVEFSPEDAGRSEPDFLCRILEAVIDAGATTLNIPDTVGYNVPWQFGNLIKDLRERIPNADKAVFSVHCHNDLGLAVANSLDAVMNGARQVECTINGLGERAGNAALEEIVMAVRTRQDVFPCDTNIDATRIMHTSRLVSRVTGFPVQKNKAIVGDNAFAHESGIHQDGIIKSRETYEIMRAEDVGWDANQQLVLGKHSGRNAVRTRLQELDINIDSEAELNRIFAAFKALADKKHEIFDDDLRAIALNNIATVSDKYQLVAYQLHEETGEIPTATLTIRANDQEHTLQAEGDGLIDAACKAIEAHVQSGTKLTSYQVQSVTKDVSAQGVATLALVNQNGTLVNGSGTDTDVVIASIKAYLDALNRLSLSDDRAHPQHSNV